MKLRIERPMRDKTVAASLGRNLFRVKNALVSAPRAREPLPMFEMPQLKKKKGRFMSVVPLFVQDTLGLDDRRLRH